MKSLGQIVHLLPKNWVSLLETLMDCRWHYKLSNGYRFNISTEQQLQTRSMLRLCEGSSERCAQAVKKSLKPSAACLGPMTFHTNLTTSLRIIENLRKLNQNTIIQVLQKIIENHRKSAKIHKIRIIRKSMKIYENPLKYKNIRLTENQWESMKIHQHTKIEE